MSGAEFELALAVLEVSIKAGKAIKGFIERYRGALTDIGTVETSVSLANCKTEQFYVALSGNKIPSRHHEPITRAIEILNPKLDDLAALLQHYNHSDGELHSIDRAHWAAFGERRAKRIKTEIDEWGRNVFELVVVTLLTDSQEYVGDTRGSTQTRADVLEFIKEVPGMELALSMKEAVAAVNLSDRSQDQPLISLDDKTLEFPKPVITSVADYDDETSLAIVKPNGRIVLEHIYIPMNDYTEVSEPQIHETTIKLATILQGSDPAHSYIPSCKGYFMDPQENRYSLFFSDRVRVGGSQYIVTPHSLRTAIQLLNNPNSKVFTPHDTAIVEALQDVESRTNMAIRLIHSLSYIHAIGWVHKGFQSSKILLAVDKIGNVFPLVLGFHRSRPSNSQFTTGDEEYDEWIQVVCRHPDRWKSKGNPTFRRRYDVYSLGVVLLELGTGKLAHEMATRRPHNRVAFNNSSVKRREEIVKQEAEEVVETFIKEASGLKKKQGKAYSENLEACFRQTRWRQGMEANLDEEDTDADFSRALLSKWVIDLSATRF